jgi:hypothetical protein
MKKTLLVIVAIAGAVVSAQPAPITPEQTLDRRGIRILAWYDKYLKPPASSGTPQR